MTKEAGEACLWSQMKTKDQLKADGLDLLAHSSNGLFEVSSYIAMRNEQKVYGYYDYVKGSYVEEPI